MRIGFRTIKTAVGTTISVVLAQILGLDFFSSAGMLTILCMQTTWKKSLETAFARFFACLVAIIVASLFFTVFGQHAIVIGLVLLVTIPIAVRFKIAGGIGTSSVVMFHLYNAPEINLGFIVDRIILVVIGIGVALAVNFYMPSADKELETYQQKVDVQFRRLFILMAQAIRGEDVKGVSKEIRKADEMIKNAKKLGIREMQNCVWTTDSRYYRYFSSKEKQLDVMKRVTPLLDIISATYEQSYMIADFLDSMADSMRPEAKESITLPQLKEMRQQFRELPLPKTVEEFENRAYLMQFVYEMEQYLSMRRTYLVKGKI